MFTEQRSNRPKLNVRKRNIQKKSDREGIKKRRKVRGL